MRGERVRFPIKAAAPEAPMNVQLQPRQKQDYQPGREPQSAPGARPPALKP